MLSTVTYEQNSKRARKYIFMIMASAMPSSRILHRYLSAKTQALYGRTSSSANALDYIEEADGNFTAFEMKWNPNKRPITFPSPFLNNYPVKETVVITPENYLEWVM